MDRPPSIDANEVTDEDHINQRAVLERGADLVARLYAGGPELIVVDWAAQSLVKSGGLPATGPRLCPEKGSPRQRYRSNLANPPPVVR